VYQRPKVNFKRQEKSNDGGGISWGGKGSSACGKKDDRARIYRTEVRALVKVGKEPEKRVKVRGAVSRNGGGKG